ncbi:UNVERIFIED_CONTAM: hypothetical protein KB579_06920 [Streptococcus canis]|uniref:hypothetical protein n=1 Tax=Streptococcus canis TaxID=1329 RepID=UPI0024DE070E|nr:hypothetical protein [Streptococcus canis]
MISLLLLSALSYPKLDGLVLTLVQGKAVTIIGLNTILLLEQVNLVIANDALLLSKML